MMNKAVGEVNVEVLQRNDSKVKKKDERIFILRAKQTLKAQGRRGLSVYGRRHERE